MNQPTSHITQRENQNQELSIVTRLLRSFDITLDDEQPHLKGERYLMQAMTTKGGAKLILVGTQTTSQQRVIIKVAKDEAGKEELRHERTCRKVLHSLPFAYNAFHSPQEVLWEHKEGYLLTATVYIDQTSTFLERPLKEQFDFTLGAFKAQESARATTKKHQDSIINTFGIKRWDDYLRFFAQFMMQVTLVLPKETEIQKTLATALKELKQNEKRIEQYGDFLTHTDFVPHNFRIKDNTLYLLDFSSIRFGNKHESWARFLNFMTLYNRDLETALLQYVADNRSAEERESLQLMRLYRLGEIIAYYGNTLSRSENDLHALNLSRVHFWHEVLRAELQNSRVSEKIVIDYRHNRDKLRSEDEKKRQIGLH